jgi:hypothetical protein
MNRAGVAASLLVLLSAALAVGASSARDGASALRIRPETRRHASDEVILKSRRFVPAAGLSATWHVPSQTVAGRVHVLLQLESIPTDEWRAVFYAAGVKLLSYVPNRAWFASIPVEEAAQVAQLVGVRALCEVQPQDKLAPSLRETGINAQSLTADREARLTALLFEDVTLEAGVSAIEALGGTMVGRDAEGSSLTFHLPVRALWTLAACDSIKWIDQHYASADLNDGVRTAIDVNPVQNPPYGLTGAGVVIGQWESKHPDATHVDLAGRVTNIEDGWPVGDHATQVAGTMIGDGRLLADRRYRGMATAATIVSYHTWDDTSDLRRQYREAIEKYGIDIANNSWGKVEWHLYKDYTAVMDGIVRGTLGKPVSLVWAVGNEGWWGTILCTAVGKNVVTVGATNSDDNSLWTWSNKGPTEDGRLKPEVVAPGCETGNGGYIWSTLPGNRYGGGCGTSLAAPSVSGTMALILEDWRGTHPSDPLPATLKGILIHTATDLGDPGPDYRFGYGLINARRAIDLVRADTLEEVVVEDALGRQGQRNQYVLAIRPGEQELKVSLAWDDYPADPLTAHALVNDLDLFVTDPNGRRYYPWCLDLYEPNKPAGRHLPDHVNNLEQVFVESPVAGVWQVAVWGTNLPQGPQSYSLLASGSSFGPASTGTTLLSIMGLLGNVVAEFDDAGNLVLQGGLTVHAEPTPPVGAFIFYGPDQSITGYIDLMGNMTIQGELNERAACTPTGGFTVCDWFGNTLASVDASGNLCLAGRLYQNP